jgi:hypothetical protein
MENDSIDPRVRPSGTGCVDCLRGSGWWLHLRRCAKCGHIGCCDASPSQHASKHFQSSAHRVMRSFEPGEAWFWDFNNKEFVLGPPLAAPDHRPLNQSAPGPAGRVPPDWQDHLH